MSTSSTNPASNRTNTAWDQADEHKMLVAMVGYRFGPDPENHIDEIRAAKHTQAQAIEQLLEISAEDTVLEIGSGCGFLAEYFAPRVRRIHCVDISQQFYEYCRRLLAPRTNAEVHKIEYAGLSFLRDRGITRVYSKAVFVHFNLFDIVNYLREVHALLPAGGRLYFDFADITLTKINENRLFADHLAIYRGHRDAILTTMNWNSADAIKHLARQTGFTVTKTIPHREVTHEVILTKSA